MKTEEITAGNVLIAKFMGLKPCLTHQKDKFGYSQCVDGFVRNDMGFPNDELRYNLKWGWLMPAVEKIEELGYFCMINRWTSVYTGNENQRISISTVEGNIKILNTWKAVILFIEWYEKDKTHDRKRG